MHETRQMLEMTRLTPSLLGLLAGLAALGSLSTNIMLPAFAGMSISLGVSSRDLGVVLSSFFAAFAAGQVLVGPLSDRYGRRPLVLGGLLLFLLGSSMCALAPTLGWLVFGRVVQALGVCAASVLARAIARDLFDGPSLTRTLALITVAMAAAPGFSPLLGGALSQAIGWRGVFLAVGVVGLLLGVYYVLATGETLPKTGRSVASVPEVVRCYIDLLIDPRFISPAASVSFILGGLYAFFGAAPALLMDKLGLSALQLGLFFASTVFVVFMAGILVPRATRLVNPLTVLRLGIAMAVAGTLVILLGAPTLKVFTLGLTMFLFGMGMVNPLGTALALQPFALQAGTASALLGFLQMGTAAITIVLCGIASPDPYVALGIILAGSTVLSLIASLGAGRETRTSCAHTDA